MAARVRGTDFLLPWISIGCPRGQTAYYRSLNPRAKKWTHPFLWTNFEFPLFSPSPEPHSHHLPQPLGLRAAAIQSSTNRKCKESPHMGRFYGGNCWLDLAPMKSGSRDGVGSATRYLSNSQMRRTLVGRKGIVQPFVAFEGNNPLHSRGPC